MSKLPKIQSPLFNIELPGFPGQDIVIRPYTTREEVILMYAAQSESRKDQLLAVEQVINNCVVRAPKTFNVDKMTATDVEYLFIKLRALSYNNILMLEYTPLQEECKGERKDGSLYGPCKGSLQFGVDLNAVELSEPMPENIKDGKFKIAVGEMELQFSIPTIQQRDLLNRIVVEDDPSAALELFSENLHTVINGEEILTAETDFSVEDAKQFCQDLPLPQKAELLKTMCSSPSVVGCGKVICGRCGFKKEQKVEGLTSFFD